MIRREKMKGALGAISTVIVECQQMAYERCPYDDMADVLDFAELLPALMIENNDVSEYFGEHLAGLAELYPRFLRAHEAYEAYHDTDTKPL